MSVGACLARTRQHFMPNAVAVVVTSRTGKVRRRSYRQYCQTVVPTDTKKHSLASVCVGVATADSRSGAD